MTMKIIYTIHQKQMNRGAFKSKEDTEEYKRDLEEMAESTTWSIEKNILLLRKEIKSMNMIKYYKERGLSMDGIRQINMIRGCILASYLDKQDKREMLDFMTALEEYLEDEED